MTLHTTPIHTTTGGTPSGTPGESPTGVPPVRRTGGSPGPLFFEGDPLVRPGTTDPTTGTPSGSPTHQTTHIDYLLTDRTRPFWTATLDLLRDTRWHHRDELYALGQTHGLAERTIANLLPRASKRRWISRGRGYVRLRDLEAFVAALDPKDGA